MLKNYIRLAFRSLLKNKVFSFINVLGLATGLTNCLLISIYIYHELSYDTHQKYADRLYQIGTRHLMNSKESRSGASPAHLCAADATLRFNCFAVGSWVDNNAQGMLLKLSVPLKRRQW